MARRPSPTTNPNDEISGDTFDANGNTTASGGHTFAYDFENRLLSKDSGAVTIIYDCDGNRVAKTVGGVTTRYLVDDLNPTGYLQALEEVVGGAVQTRYTYGDRIVSQTAGVSSTPATSYYGYDAHGNITFLTDSAGAVTDSYDYDAWGNVVAHTGLTPNTRLYAADEFDPDLGLINLRARQYKSEIGRFLTMDPLSSQSPDLLPSGKSSRPAPQRSMLPQPPALPRWPQFRAMLEILIPKYVGTGHERVFNPTSQNAYLYGNGDPVDLIDPLGLGAADEYAILVEEDLKEMKVVESFGNEADCDLRLTVDLWTCFEDFIPVADINSYTACLIWASTRFAVCQLRVIN